MLGRAIIEHRDFWRTLAPFAAAAMLACGFGLSLGDPRLPRASAEGGMAAIASAALGPVGAAAPYAPPVASLAGVAGVPFRAGAAIDESYRLAFAECDRRNVFRGHRLDGKPCTSEPSRFAAFVRLKGGAVYMQAHLGLDLAGSHAACDGKPSDGCSSFFDFASAPSAAYDDLGAHWRELFPVSDKIALVSVPLRAGPDAGAATWAGSRAFADASGVSIGDIGVVIYRDRIVPVMVSNAAPRYRALAGSLGLFDAIGVTRCRKRLASDHTLCAEPKEYGLGAPVIAVLFPKSALKGLTPSNIADRVAAAALERFAALRKDG
ncbi:MAG: hypothetical protein MRY74_06080 [Neomegalonema sp.]|nr:hypothetical protein [Neomegalonema sp.]